MSDEETVAPQPVGWKLWLDDLVFDEVVTERHAPPGFTPAKSMRHAQKLIQERGMPEFMDLDHDLGRDSCGVDFPSGADFCKWLVGSYLWEIKETKKINFNIHSANPNGAANMESILNSWNKFHGFT